MCTPTVLTGHEHKPVRYTSVDTAARRSTALQDDTRRDREETARQRENSQLAGRFRRWWQVLGSNQRRLSRRFYALSSCPSHPPLTSAIRRSRRDLRAAAVRYASVGAGFRGPRGRRTVGRPRTGTDQPTDGHGPAHGRGRKRPRTGPVGAVMQTALTRIPALTWHFRMPARCRRRPRHRGLPRRPGCRGPRRCAGWRRSPGRRCSGRRS